MEEHFAGIIEGVGEDLDREGLIDTPKRAAKAFKFLKQRLRENAGRSA